MNHSGTGPSGHSMGDVTGHLLREAGTAAIAKILTKLIEDDPDVKASIVEAAKTIAVEIAKSSTNQYEIRSAMQRAVEAGVRKLLEEDVELQAKIRADVRAHFDATLAAVSGTSAGIVAQRVVALAVDAACSDMRRKIGDWK